jgi:hypothetical protein
LGKKGWSGRWPSAAELGKDQGRASIEHRREH